MTEREYSDDQILHERRMARLGSDRYRARINKARQLGKESSAGAGKQLLRSSVRVMTKALQKHRKVRSRSRPKKLMGRMSSQLLAALTCQVVLDELSRPRGYTSLCVSIGRRIDEERMMRQLREGCPSQWKRLRSKYTSYNTFRDKARRKAGDLELYERWSTRDRSALGMFLLEIFLETTGLCEVQVHSHYGKKSKRIVTIKAEALEWLERSHEAHEAVEPYYLPMLSPPADWTDVEDGGYYTGLVTRRPLVKTSPEMLQRVGRHDMPEVYRSVNRLQSVPWTINEDVLEVVQYFWDTTGGEPFAGLPGREDAPLPPRLPDDASDEEKLQRRRERAGVRQYNVGQRSQRLQVMRMLRMGHEYVGKRLWFPLMMDFRGRTYPIPYFVQPQGTDLARGLLLFSDGAALRSEEAENALAIHGANLYGKDKLPLTERVQWAWENDALIRSVGDDPIDGRPFWEAADDPWQFLAWCIEWAHWRDDPNYVSHLPCHADGTNNGLQLYSLLLRDPAGAKATNCMPGDRPEDIYQDVADAAFAMLHEPRSSPEDQHLASRWLEFLGPQGLPRSSTKRAVMTMPYGVTAFSMRQYIEDWLREEEKRRGQERFFGPREHWDALSFLCSTISRAIDVTVYGARDCMDWLRECAGLFVEEDRPVKWVAPNGFLALQTYQKMTSRQVRTIVGDRIAYLTYKEARKELDRRRMVNGLPPNFIHSLDAAVLSRTVTRMPEGAPMSTVHDSYGTLAAHYGTMQRQLRQAVVDIFSADLLEDLRTQFASQLRRSTIPEPPERGDFDVQEVASSEYFFS